MKVYVITGEKSGDQHAGDVLAELKKMCPSLAIRGVGGSGLKKAGGVCFKDYNDLAIMGFAEVLMRFREIRTIMLQVQKDIAAFQPDVLLLVDFAGFNLRIAKYAAQRNISVFYFIPPKAWAWNKSRVHSLRKYTKQVGVIFPFEVPFFCAFGVDAVYVGNPSLEQIDKSLQASVVAIETQKPIVALLPGSRKQEIKAAIGVFNELIDYLPGYQLIIAGVSNLPEEVYSGVLPGIEVVMDDTLNLLRQSRAAVVTSGTASLECALIGVPQVVVYRTSPITYFLARELALVKYISLVNLLLDKPLIKELIQDNFTAAKVALWIKPLLSESNHSRKDIESGYRELRNLLGHKKASQETARLILELEHD
jgi:lipid-A-disaccharide synthase